MSLLMTLLLVVFVLALVGGGVGHSRFGFMGWSPAAVLLAVFVALYFTGNLN